MAGVLRHSVARSTRQFSSSRLASNASTPAVGVTPAPKRPIGGLRGGIVGFLFGFSVAASYASYNLLDEYQRASAALQASVDELKLTTHQVTDHIRRIEAVEKDLKTIQQSTTTREETSKVRTEMKKLYDGLHVELLDLRSHVWGIQQDLQALTKKA